MKAKLLTVVFLFLSGTTIALAQTGAGTIQGSVKDQSGAVVPNAQVEIVQTQTALKHETTTNTAGLYVFPSVLIGPYEITVQAPGMETWKTELTLQAGQTAEVDAELKVGATATQVTVSANITPLVNTTDGTMATVVERARIEQLPINVRNIDTIVYATTPGIEQHQGAIGPDAPTVYGVLYGSEFTQDGALLENRDWQKLPDRLPGLDTIEEFRAETSNSSAKMERPGSVTLTTRHGTNQIHGSAFDTNRDNSFGVARRREDYYDKAPHLVRNEFGVSVGGPVYLPKLYDGKDKTFFFFSYEGFRLRQNLTIAAAVPTAAMRNGDFSGLLGLDDPSLAHTYQLYNPFSTRATPANPYARDPFMCDSAGSPLPLNPDNTQTATATSVPCNVIPPSLESPLAKYLSQQTPLPTLSNVNPVLANNFFGLGVNNQSQNTSTLRLDHQITPQNQVFFRYSHGTNRRESANGLNGPEPIALNNAFNLIAPKGQNDTGVVSWTHTFSPTFFGETLFTLSRDYHAELPATGTQSFASALGLPDPTNFFSFPRIESVGSSQNGSWINYDACGCNINIGRARVWDLHENLTKTRGRHEFQFGGQIQYEKDDTLPDQQDSAGDHLFDSFATSLYDPVSGTAFAPVPYTGFDAANLFLGVGRYTIRYNRAFYYERVNSKMLYFQDNIKATPRLTLNLGVRYEYNSPMHEANDSLQGFDPKTHAIVLQTSIDNLAKAGDVAPQIAAAYAAVGVTYETPAQAGLPHNLVYPNYYDFNPRLAFAYRLTTGEHYSVLRGGYGIFSYPDSLRLWNGNTQFTTPTTGFVANDPNQFASQSPDGNPNWLLRSVPTIIAGQNSQNALDLSQVQGISAGSGQVFWVDPHEPTTRAAMWNLTYEKELAPNTALSLAYVGTHAYRLPQYYSINDVPSDFIWYTTTGQPKPANFVDQQPFDQVYGTTQEYLKTGWSNDNSFQIELQHQYSKGYAYQVFYVLSSAFRAAGDGWRSDYVLAPNLFPTGTMPPTQLLPIYASSSQDAVTDTFYHQADRLQNYHRDWRVPQHHLQWNWIADLPFGRGKTFGRDAGGVLNAIIGGWQFAGLGQVYSRWFSPPTTLYGPWNGVQTYGKNFKVQDCTSGQCQSGFLWWNGYIQANQINQPGGLQGIPSSYKPSQTPRVPTPANGGSASDPLSPYYESNEVCVDLATRAYQTLTAASPCLAGAPGYQLANESIDLGWWTNPWNPSNWNQYFRGPKEWTMDASLFKTFKIREDVNLRFNMDFFNVFNRPGTNMPDSRGFITNQYSDLDPRVMQLTLRLTW